MTEKIMTIDNIEQVASLFGSFDENIRIIENEYGVSIVSRGSDLKIIGKEEGVSNAGRAVNSMLGLISKG